MPAVDFIPDLAWRRTTLRQTPKDERKIALILPHGILANALHRDDSGDLLQAAVDLLRTLAAAGYRVTDLPADGVALIRALHDAPIDAEETFPRSDYGIFLNGLPRAVQDGVGTRWGAPERDPCFRESRLDCGAFVIPAIRCGNIIIAIEPSRGDDIAAPPDGVTAAPGSRPPRHGYLAFYAWLADGVRVHAVVHLGKAGGLEWLLSDDDAQDDTKS